MKYIRTKFIFFERIDETSFKTILIDVIYLIIEHLTISLDLIK